MQTPRFWSNPRTAPGWTSHALLPASWLWRLATARRLRAGPWEQMPIPVVCVGNLTAGGTGKTPTVAALLERLRDNGVDAGALYRGYKGILRGPEKVEESHHSADDVGDEALLTAAIAPTWIARDRVAGIRAMTAAGCTMAIMDDGFQNPGVKKDLSIIVVDAQAGFGNGRIIPAGPLREPIASGLARADMVLTIGHTEAQQALESTWPELVGTPRIRGELVPLQTGMPWQGLRCLAFAGIGRPGKFFASLKQAGAEVVRTQSFPDHAAYPRPVLQRLLTDAQRLNAQLVTTEKDAVRLPRDIRSQVLTLPVRLRIEDWTLLDQALSRPIPSEKKPV